MSGWVSVASPAGAVRNAVRGAASGPNNSIVFKLLAYKALDLQALFDFGRVFVLRRDAEERGDALNDPAGGRDDGPAGGCITVAFLGAVRLVNQGQHDIVRM